MPQQDIGLLQYIAEQEEKRDRLKKELKDLDVVIQHARQRAETGDIRKAILPPGAASEPIDTPKPEGPYVGMGNEAAVLRCLQSAGKGLTTDDVCKALKAGGIESKAKNFHTAIFSALSRLVGQGKARKMGRGSRARWVAVRPDTPPSATSTFL